METPKLPAIRALRPAWNRGRIAGQKRPLEPKHVWAIRVRLELAENHRDLALFNMAIDSKLRGCDLVKMKVVDVMASGQIKERASVLQTKNPETATFRDFGRHSCLGREMDGRRTDGRIRVSLAGPVSRTPAHLDSPVCSNCQGLGHINWPKRALGAAQNATGSSIAHRNKHFDVRKEFPQ